MNQEENIDELIALVLAGEANTSQVNELEAWKKSRPENQKYFDQMALVFQQSALIKETQTFSVDKAWEKVKQQSLLKENPSEPRLISMIKPWMSIAATLIVLAGISWLVLQNHGGSGDVANAQLLIASGDSVKNEKLMDGSEITLNKNTHLFYDNDFNLKERKLKLSGEAYFKVIHNATKPFSVWVGDLQVLDIGTEFNIQALAQSDSVVVDVSEGSVQMNFGQQKPVTLIAGERGVYYKKEKNMKKMLNTDRNALSWKNKIFVFENTELHTVLSMLNDLYHSQIILENPELEKCRLNAQFNNESLDEMIEVIAATFNLKVTRTERSILLDGKSCGLE